MMVKTICVFLAVLLALVFFPLAPAALAQDRLQAPVGSGEEMMADLVLARPAGIVSTVVGTGLFIVSLPFSALGGNVQDAWDHLVEDPARFTFQRPLGRF
jgi:hypothetical protein